MGRILIALALGASIAGATPALAGKPATGNPTAGKAVYKAKCAMCHGDTATSPAGIGPRLFGVMGRKAGTLPGYAYSPAMKNSGVTWSHETMERYLANPQATVRGNRMPFAGMPVAADRDNVAAYLETLR